MKHNIQLLNYQLEAIMATEPEVLVSAGIGTGKSYIGANWILSKALTYQGCRLLIAANTYSQLMGASVKTLTTLLDDMKIPYKAILSGARKRIEIGKSMIYLYSLDKPDTIRGIEVSYAWLDEVAFSTLKAMNVVRGRMRGKGTPNRQIFMTSSPNGYNWLYDIFGSSKLSKKKRLIKAQTLENVFLPDGYYDDLLELYGGTDSPLARQELFGEFVNLQEGAIYNLFNRGINVLPCQLNRNYPVYVGMDFNIEQMNATYCQYIGGVIYVCKEVKLTHRDANTHDMGKKILEDLKGYSFQVVPDSTGNARKTSTSSGKTDHQILKDLGITVMETHNPFIRDRQNSVNILFLKKKLVIDPSCINTIKEIETLSSRDQEGKVSHLSVTVGYVTWKLAPLQPPTKPSRTIQM